MSVWRVSDEKTDTGLRAGLIMVEYVTRYRDGFRCLNCDALCEDVNDTAGKCPRVGCGFKVGRYRTDLIEYQEIAPKKSLSLDDIVVLLIIGIPAALVLFSFVKWGLGGPIILLFKLLYKILEFIEYIGS